MPSQFWTRHFALFSKPKPILYLPISCYIFPYLKFTMYYFALLSEPAFFGLFIQYEPDCLLYSLVIDHDKLTGISKALSNKRCQPIVEEGSMEEGIRWLMQLAK